LLERGVPVDVRVFAPNPVALSADELDTPAITVWHGDGDSFGQHGQSIPFVNILGNVQPANDIVLLRYQLNEGGFITLEVGPDPGVLTATGRSRTTRPLGQAYARSNMGTTGWFRSAISRGLTMKSPFQSS
jgi:hypothetical protein